MIQGPEFGCHKIIARSIGKSSDGRLETLEMICKKYIELNSQASHDPTSEAVIMAMSSNMSFTVLLQAVSGHSEEVSE